MPILKGITAMGLNNPATKIRPLGFLQMLLSRMDDSVQWSDNYKDGHETQLKVKFRNRPLESEVRDNEDGGCDVASNPAYNEFTVDALQHREVSFHLTNSQIRQYTADASKLVTIDQTSGVVNLAKPTQIMQEVYSLFIEYGNALFGSINKALVTQQSTRWGLNTVTASAAARALTFNLSSVAMQDALITLMTDWRENEMTDDVAYVGSGPFANLDLLKKFYSTMPNAQGFNMAALNNSLNSVWFDKDARSIWGADQIGMFAKGSVHLLTRNMWEGSFAQKLANSTFFNMALPIQDQVLPLQFLDRMKFDVQIKEVDCPTEIDLNGVPTTIKEGVVVFLKKKFTLFNIPELFNAADPLYGTNGTLRYTISACDPVCDPG